MDMPWFVAVPFAAILVLIVIVMIFVLLGFILESYVHFLECVEDVRELRSDDDEEVGANG